MKNKSALRGAWNQPSPRAEMLAEVKALDSSARMRRLAVRYVKFEHIDDEVVVTLMLDAWKSEQDREANTYSCEVLRRVTVQVKAHVRKNPGWQRLGGGADAVIDDFSSEIVCLILKDETVPCHAEIAFGDYVYKRCLELAGKLYAKKHSAGQSLDEEDGSVELEAMMGDTIDSLAMPKSPVQVLIEMEEFLADEEILEKIRLIVQENLPEKPAIAFTLRYFGNMKIESKRADTVTVTSLMDVTEKTATKYINQAIEIIKQRLEL